MIERGAALHSRETKRFKENTACVCVASIEAGALSKPQ